MESYYEINKRDVLVQELKRYKSILSKEIYDYFNALISLEKSVIDGTISEEEDKMLSFLPFYRSIVKYNIYNHALNVLGKENIVSKQSLDYRNSRANFVSCEKLRGSCRTIEVLNLSISKDNTIELELFNALSDEDIKQKEFEDNIPSLLYH